MRPGLAAVVGEVLAVAPLAQHRRPGLHLADFGLDSAILGVVQRLLLGGEAQPHLGLGVGGGGPAHQRIGLAPGLVVVFQHPALRAGRAGLHGVAGGSVDAGGHCAPPSRFGGTLPDSAPKRNTPPSQDRFAAVRP